MYSLTLCRLAYCIPHYTTYFTASYFLACATVLLYFSAIILIRGSSSKEGSSDEALWWTGRKSWQYFVKHQCFYVNIGDDMFLTRFCQGSPGGHTLSLKYLCCDSSWSASPDSDMGGTRSGGTCFSFSFCFSCFSGHVRGVCFAPGWSQACTWGLPCWGWLRSDLC